MMHLEDEARMDMVRILTQEKKDKISQRRSIQKIQGDKANGLGN